MATDNVRNETLNYVPPPALNTNVGSDNAEASLQFVQYSVIDPRELQEAVWDDPNSRDSFWWFENHDQTYPVYDAWGSLGVNPILSASRVTLTVTAREAGDWP